MQIEKDGLIGDGHDHEINSSVVRSPLTEASSRIDNSSGVSTLSGSNVSSMADEMSSVASSEVTNGREQSEESEKGSASSRSRVGSTFSSLSIDTQL